MPRKKLFFQEIIACFSCGLPMGRLDDTTWQCDDCEVQEEHKNYVSHLRMTSADWWGGTVYYVDHSKEYCPSPA